MKSLGHGIRCAVNSMTGTRLYLGTKGLLLQHPLFKVDEDAVKLDQAMAKAFHNITAKGIYVAKRVRPDISLSIAFLTTRVKGPDIDDWRKLCHLVEYLCSTRGLPLILAADGTGVLSWYVDASFAVHPDMKGHTGGAMTMGRDFLWISQPNTNSTHVALQRVKLLLWTI